MYNISSLSKYGSRFPHFQENRVGLRPYLIINVGLAAERMNGPQITEVFISNCSSTEIAAITSVNAESSLNYS